MTSLFIYNINGTIIEDTIAFGEAWKEAKALATKLHCGIFRQVVRGEEIRNEFYTKGIFLNEKFFEPERLEIF